MELSKFLETEFNSIIRQYNNSHDKIYCMSSSLEGKKKTLSFIIEYLEEAGEYWGIYDNAKTLLENISVVQGL